MVKWDLKKIFIKQYGSILLVVFIVLEIIFAFEIPSKKAEDKFYQEYMTAYSGEMTAIKEEMILAESTRLSEIHNTESFIKNEFLLGRISEDEYIAKYKEIKDELIRAKAFEGVWQQYMYATGNPIQRYIVSDIPDDLTSEQPDYILALIILILSTGAFLYEHQNNMLPFMRTSQKGRNKAAMCKIWIVLVGTFVFSAIRHIIHWCMGGNVWASLDYPIQSIEFYQNCPYSLTIAETLIAVFLLRTLGYMTFAVIGVICVELSRNSVLSLFIPLFYLIAPHLLFEKENLIYNFPGPTGMIMALGYLKGNSFEKVNEGLLTETTVQSFTEISLLQMFLMIIMCVAIILFGIILVNKRYRNCNNKKEKCRLLPLMLILPLCLTGCAKSESQVINIGVDAVYRTETGFYCSGEYGLYICDENGENAVALFRNSLDDGEKSIKIQSGCFADNSYYYSTFAGQIFRIDLDTLKRYKIFTKETSPRKLLMGLITIDPDMTDTDIEYIFANDNDVFAVTYGGTIQKILKGNRTKTILEVDIYEKRLAFDGENIYYINQLLELKKYSFSDNTSALITDKPCQSLQLTEDGWFFESYGVQYLYNGRENITK